MQLEVELVFPKIPSCRLGMALKVLPCLPVLATLVALLDYKVPLCPSSFIAGVYL